ncbi:hypothetical protein WJX72_004614 [[Myrmecia] bisecta]|uniref:CP12 domain-containing protein n=1 Tax=[Myrmecia] bisecta TaxID=41462 RepID=A0AAW1PWP9_9CHLO
MASMIVLTTRPAVLPVRATSLHCSRLNALTSQPRLRVIRRADPKGDKSAVETAIESAKETCEQGTTGECAAAWDEVEELSASAADKKAAAASSDPLEQYCDDNPEADECRVYED